MLEGLGAPSGGRVAHVRNQGTQGWAPLPSSSLSVDFWCPLQNNREGVCLQEGLKATSYYVLQTGVCMQKTTKVWGPDVLINSGASVQGRPQQFKNYLILCLISIAVDRIWSGIQSSAHLFFLFCPDTYTRVLWETWSLNKAVPCSEINFLEESKNKTSLYFWG